MDRLISFPYRSGTVYIKPSAIDGVFVESAPYRDSEGNMKRSIKIFTARGETAAIILDKDIDGLLEDVNESQ